MRTVNTIITERNIKNFDIAELNIKYEKLDSLEGIEKFPNLETLVCYGNQITDLKPLENCSNLEYLYCSDNQITTLKPLEKFKNLEDLDCSGNPIPHFVNPKTGRKVYKSNNLYYCGCCLYMTKEILKEICLEKEFYEVIEHFGL